MAEALKLHIEHEETLHKSHTQLEMTNRQLVAEKELNQKLVKEKIKQNSRHRKQIKEQQVNISCPLCIVRLFVFNNKTKWSY